MKAEEKLWLALVEYYYKIFLNQTFLRIFSKVIKLEGGTSDLEILKIPQAVLKLSVWNQCQKSNHT